MYTIPQQFDLSKNIPIVLLLGNGILKSCAEVNDLDCKKWEDHLYKLSEKPLSKKDKEDIKDVPYSLKATLLAPCDDVNRHKKYVNQFKTLEFSNNDLIKDLVLLGFDAILTTNYTYEIENCFNDGFNRLKDKSKYIRTIMRSSLKNVDTKYLLHTFNQFDNSPPIWHIHGEERRKSSIVLTHDEYSRLIHKLVDENIINKNKFVDFQAEVKYKSWLDYLLVSNLYIVGLGMDFSEFDLWWILNRRMREKSKKGKIILFESNNMNESIKNALKSLEVSVIQFADIKENDYIGLYKKATEYIKNELKTLKGVL